MAIFKYTTTIDPERTISEIARLLVPRGATGILSEYDENQRVSAVSFKMVSNGQTIGFRLPCQWRPILTILNDDRKVPSKLKTNDQAIRVAWRIVHAWVEAQMALVDTQMVEMRSIFLPYTVMKDGKTLAEHVEDNPNFLLGNGN